MHCRNCGKQVNEKAVACTNCGMAPQSGKKYCQECGAETNENQVVCIKCGVSLKATNENGKDWLTALLLAIFLGGLGVHRFYTGHTAIGVVQLLTLGGCGIWSLIDIIMIATGSFKDAKGNELVRR